MMVSSLVDRLLVRRERVIAQSSLSVLINGFGVLFVILNSFGLGLRLAEAERCCRAYSGQRSSRSKSRV